jgi:hypothetical protein
LVLGSDDNQYLITALGDQALNAKEKIHSIVKLNGKAYRSMSQSFTADKIIYTSLSTGIPTADSDVVVTYLNGPLIRVNLDKVTTDLTVKIKAKAAYKPVGTEEKTFAIKNIKPQENVAIKSLATETKKAAFKVGTATEIEDFVEVSGAAVDLTLTGENAKWFTFKPRKAGPISFPLSSKDNQNLGLMKFDNYLVSVFNGKQLQFNY